MGKPLEATSGHGDGWSVELDGGGGSAWRGLAGALALGGSEAGIRVCGFCVRAQSQCRPKQATVGARRCCSEVGAEGNGLGEVPGVEEETIRCLAGAPVRRSG
jgi:hypothetical protein